MYSLVKVLKTKTQLLFQNTRNKIADVKISMEIFNNLIEVFLIERSLISPFLFKVILLLQC